MAKVLLIESATTMCSVAIADGDEILASQLSNDGFTHAENLTEFIKQVSQQSIVLKDIDAVVVSKGPGSYTGLRIGVAAAKGICYALNKPLIAINTLYSLFSGVKKTHPNFDYYIPMLDARRMEVYTAIFSNNSELVEDTNALILDENSFSNIPKQSKICFFGDGSAKFKTISKFENAIFVEDAFPFAEFMNEMAQEKFENKQFEDVAYFEPYYLKEFYMPQKA
ncbi:MAG: tRNA (adenosine(37)-N6)-threonylcarbamoyltransferase complex dimerization subunit type 1 TsaB [Bacteroidota bacterium]